MMHCLAFSTAVMPAALGGRRRVANCRQRSARQVVRMGDATRVLVLGGTGRVGGETVRSLFDSGLPVELTVAGRRTRNVALGDGVQVRTVEVCDHQALHAAVADHDVVVHTAGPFQRRAEPNEVLRAVLAHPGTDYVDICDDVAHAAQSKALGAAARAAGCRALICTGIYPGLSNLAAAAAVDRLRGAPRKLRIHYYTAGSGGIGATVLASTFLILGTEALCFRGGRAVEYAPASQVERKDFGGAVGKRATYHINLPEVSSLHATLQAPHGGGDAWAKFSTGPPMWNALLRAMAHAVPRDLLRNRPAMQALARFSIPIVRAVDVFVGARTAFTVEVEDDHGRTVHVAYEHEALRRSVGTATAAFIAEACRDRQKARRDIAAGVYYPEELPQAVRNRICLEGVRGAERYELTESAAALHVEAAQGRARTRA